MESYIKQAKLLMTALLTISILVLLSVIERPIDVEELGLELIVCMDALPVTPELPERLSKISKHSEHRVGRKMKIKGTFLSKEHLSRMVYVKDLLELRLNVNAPYAFKSVKVYSDEGDRELIKFNNLSSKLDSVYNSVGGGRDITIGQLSEISKKKVHLPVINNAVSIKIAFPFLFGSLLVIGVYLTSNFYSLYRIVTKLEDFDVSSWIFFHFGPIGIVTGVCWITLPILAIVAVTWRGYLSVLYTLLLLLAYGVIVYFQLRYILIIRKRIMGKIML